MDEGCIQATEGEEDVDKDMYRDHEYLHACGCVLLSVYLSVCLSVCMYVCM